MNSAFFLNPKPLIAVAALTLLVLALALPGIRAMPVTDRDEARYAQASRQMVESGDYVQIRFLNEARNKKPAGIYWLQSASVRLTGIKDEIWPYRLVSVLGALLAVLFVYGLARRLQPEAPLLPALALAACPLLVCVSHAATTDAVLAATICAAQLCLARVYLGANDKAAGSGILAAPGFWLALGIGILVKGPIAPMVAGLTMAALCLHDRDLRWLRGLRPSLGIPLMLLIVLPWLVAIQRKTGFLQESVGKDFLAKILGAQEMHGALPGAYLAAAGFLFWPLFPLAWRGLGRAWQARRSDPVARFLLAWLVPSWLLLELAPTKLPHYVLPLYPALALLAAREMRVFAGEVPSATTFVSRIWGLTCRIADATWWIAAAAFMVGPLLAAGMFGWTCPLAASVCGAAAFLASLACWRQRRRPAAAVAMAVGFALLFFATLFAYVVPRLDDLWLTRKVAAMVATQTHGKAASVVSVGYTEPSMAFAFGTQTILTGGVERAVQELRSNPAAIALIQDVPLLPVGDNCRAWLCRTLAVPPKGRHREQFLAAAAQAGVQVREVASVDGLNYSRTKLVRVIMYRTQNAE